METNSLKALALKVLQRNQTGNSQETEKEIKGNSGGVKVSLKTVPETNLYTHQDNDSRTTQVFQFDDIYHNRYVSLSEGGEMFVNMCCTHLHGSSEGFKYMTVIPLTIEHSTGCIRIFEWASFTVSEQNCVAGLYESSVVRPYELAMKGKE